MGNVAISYCSSLTNYLKKNRVFEIHSVFRNGFNLVDKEKIIYIGNYQGPSSIYISDNLTSLLVEINKKNSKKIVLYNSKEFLFFDNAIYFPLIIDRNSSVDYQMPNIELSKDTLSSLYTEIINFSKITGFGMSVKSFIEISYDQFLKNPVVWLEHFFGRGKGLTPSGDDCITGLLAIDTIHPFLPDAFKIRLDELIISKKTNDISLSFLKNAKSGLFSRDVITLFSSSEKGHVIDEQLKIISNFGSTSGMDILSGIALAIAVQWRLL